MKIRDILEIIDAAAPFKLQEKWDNCGLQVGAPGWQVKKIMVALDVSLELMQAAKKNGSDLVLTHHPLLIQGKRMIDFSQMPGQAIEIAARHKIGIVSAHTNLDKAVLGLNDYFAHKIGLKNLTTLLPDDILSDGDGCASGIGRCGIFDSPMVLGRLAKKIKEQLGLDHVRVIGDVDTVVETAAVCTGSGASLLNEYIASGSDLFITGDVKYHDARFVEEKQKTLIDVGHFGSEHIAIDLLHEKISKAAGSGIKIEKYKLEKDPFKIV